MAIAMLITLLCASWVHSSGASCDELGFVTGHTLCSDCKQLSEMVKDAVLEVCFFHLSSTPHVEGFVKKHKAKPVDGLRVVDRWGAPPRIILTDGKSQESVRIDGWKTEQIEEFLKNKLDTSK